MTKKQFSVFDIRKTDKKKSKEGVWIDYGPFAFKVRPMGVLNKEFMLLTESTFRPYRPAMNAGTMDETLMQKLSTEVFCKAVLVNWRKTVDGKHTEGVLPDALGNDIQFSVEAAINVFTEATGALDDLCNHAAEIANFKEEEIESTVKN